MESEEWKNLYTIFKNNRNELGHYLELNGGYDQIKNLLIDIEKNKSHIGNIIKKLFLGSIGHEINKQKAIYELPTTELLEIISFICQFYNITKIEELCAGQGLLSHLLKIKLGPSYNIHATDGNRCMETSDKKKYYDVENKMFLSYCLGSAQQFGEELVIISWMPHNDYTDFELLLDKNPPKYLLIIDYNHTQHIDKLDVAGYHFMKIYGKQISYQDYFNNNITEIPKSTILFATTEDNIKSLALQIKIKLDHCLVKREDHMDKNILYDTIKKLEIEYIIPGIQHNNTKKIVLMVHEIVKKKLKIPKYIKSLDELNVWFLLAKNKLFPLNIHSRKKFIEYKTNTEKLNLPDGLENLKNEGIIRNWVNDHQTAIRYLWLEYSSEIKNWKHSQQQFQYEYTIMRNTQILTF